MIEQHGSSTTTTGGVDDMIARLFVLTVVVALATAAHAQRGSRQDALDDIKAFRDAPAVRPSLPATPAVRPSPPATDALPKWTPKTIDEFPRFLCEWFDNMKLLSEKCEVSHWRQTIDIAGDLTASDARAVCAKVREFKMPLYGWQLRIFTPHTVRPIASCEFIDLR
jgi:hypothetical protein